jgi:hypothetical protein
MLCELKLNLNLKIAKINMKTGYETHEIIRLGMNLSKYSEYFSQYLTRCIKELVNLVN